MTSRLMLVIPCCLTLALPLTTVQAQPPAGRLLASQCAQCHGTNGRAVGDIDSLAGESARELYDELLEMKNGNDANDIMHRQAKGYSDAQLWLIAQYYATLNSGGSNSGTGSDSGRKSAHEDD